MPAALGATSTRVLVKLDKRRINAMLSDVTDASAGRAARRVAARARAIVVAKDRVDTGTMRDSITHRRVNHGVVTTYAVYTDVPYAHFQEVGIGPVYPVKAKVLRFKPKGATAFIFRPHTKGFKGAYFMRDAYRSLRMADYLP